MLKLDAHYTDPALTALYDIESGWSQDRAYYLGLGGGETAKTILDVGCGTGLLADAYAQAGHRVTGVDPAQAMLDIAKDRNTSVRWVCDAAADFELKDRFDLIIMTGHAFQVFLNDADTHAALSNIARHLAPTGTFVFETRNPKIEWARIWQGDRTLCTSQDNIPMQRNIDAQGEDWIRFTTIYHLSDGPRQSQSMLRFPTCAKTQDLLATSGLKANHIYGDWDGNTFEPDVMKEMIFHCSPAK